MACLYNNNVQIFKESLDDWMYIQIRMKIFSIIETRWQNRKKMPQKIAQIQTSY